MFLLALTSIGLTSACIAEGPTEKQIAVPEIVLQDLSFRAHRGARLTAQGTADRVSYRRDTGALLAERVRVELVGSHGPVTLASPAARGNGRTKDFVLTGGVRLSQGATTVQTEEARYLPSEGMVRGDRPVAIRTPDCVLSGPRFTLDPRSETLRVEGGPRAVFGGAQ